MRSSFSSAARRSSIVGRDFGFGLAVRFGVGHLALHAVEGVDAGSIAGGHFGVAGFTYGPRPAMLGEKQVGLGLRFSELSLQLA